MSRARTLAAAALLVATILVSPAAAFYSSKGPVVELTSSNLKDKVKGAGVMLVEFYAPWQVKEIQITSRFVSILERRTATHLARVSLPSSREQQVRSLQGECRSMWSSASASRIA